MAPKNRIKTQSVKKKKNSTKPAKTQATRDAEKTKERKRTGKAAPLRSSIRVIVRGVPYKLRKFENLGARQLPETYFTRKGMTLRQLIRNTPRLFVQNAVEVDAHRYKKKRTATGKPALHGIMITNDPFKPGSIRRYHESYIVGLDENGADKPVHKHKRVLVQCTCVTGDTKVLTDQGWKTIFEIAQPHTPGHYPLNYNVKGEMVAGSAPFYTGKKKVYKLTFSNGHTVTATEDHQFLKHTPLGNRKMLEEWKELRDLSVGDRLLLNDFAQPVIERTQEYWEAFFIGVMQGDGTLFNTGYPNLKLFGQKRSILKVLTHLGLVKDVSDVKGRDAVNVQFTQRAIELCYRYQFDNKRSVKIETHEQMLGYVAGLVATDGTTYANGDVLIRGAKEYLEQLSWTLFEHGYAAHRLYKERDAGIKTCVVQEDYGMVTSTKEMWALRISNQADIVKNLALSLYHSGRIKNDVQKPVKAATKIVDISYAGRQHVYDITVPGPHRFTVNGGVIAHNCENFVYMWEYANAAHGCSRLIYNNGNMPVWTNPTLVPALCKHLIALSKIAIENDL